MASTAKRFAALDAAVGVGHDFAELVPVGQVGQAVVAGEVANLRLGAALFGDVLVGRDPAAVRHRLVDDRNHLTVLQFDDVGFGVLAFVISSCRRCR